MRSSGDSPQARHRSSIFWDVDTQVDFVLPEGRLYAPGAERIIPNLERLTQHARRHRILVVASMDAHRSDDPEFSQWPPHCVLGTPGQRKIDQTRIDTSCLIPTVPAELPGDLSQLQQIIVEKQTTDVFSNPNLGALLERIGKPEVTVYGLVTEICVAGVVRGLLTRGYRVRIVTDAIRPLREEDGKRSLAELMRLGARLVTTEEVLKTGDGATSVVSNHS